MVRPIVRCHHERADGSGYPDGLIGADIPLLAQIMGVVDVYDALTTDRPYRPALAAEDACSTLEREADRGWRRVDLVQEFTTLCRSGVLRRPETMAVANVHDVALFECISCQLFSTQNQNFSTYLPLATCKFETFSLVVPISNL